MCRSGDRFAEGQSSSPVRVYGVDGGGRVKPQIH